MSEPSIQVSLTAAEWVLLIKGIESLWAFADNHHGGPPPGFGKVYGKLKAQVDFKAPDTPTEPETGVGATRTPNRRLQDERA